MANWEVVPGTVGKEIAALSERLQPERVDRGFVVADPASRDVEDGTWLQAFDERVDRHRRDLLLQGRAVERGHDDEVVVQQEIGDGEQLAVLLEFGDGLGTKSLAYSSSSEQIRGREPPSTRRTEPSGQRCYKISQVFRLAEAERCGSTRGRSEAGQATLPVAARGMTCRATKHPVHLLFLSSFGSFEAEVGATPVGSPP